MHLHSNGDPSFAYHKALIQFEGIAGGTDESERTNQRVSAFGLYSGSVNKCKAHICLCVCQCQPSLPKQNSIFFFINFSSSVAHLFALHCLCLLFMDLLRRCTYRMEWRKTFYTTGTNAMWAMKAMRYMFMYAECTFCAHQQMWLAGHRPNENSSSRIYGITHGINLCVFYL